MKEIFSTKKRFSKPLFGRWRNWLATIVILLSLQVNVSAQLSAYGFSTSEGGVLDPMTGSTQLVASNSDDGNSVLTDIGFTFNYHSVDYTKFGVSANGFMRLGAIPATGQPNYINSSGNINSQSPMIFPYWDDIHTGTDGKVHYKVIGDAPNRILIVEWYVRVTGSAGANAKFQTWLHETSNKIIFVYDAVPAVTRSYSVGLGILSNNFQSVNTTTNTNSTATFADNQTGAIGAGRIYQFTPPLCGRVTGGAATNITATTATLNWIGSSNSATYDIEWMLSTQNPGEGTTISNLTSATYNLEGLTSGTAYRFYVKNKCGVDGESDLAGPFLFTTGCSVPTTPTGITFGTVSTTSMVLNFEASDAGAYVVFRSTSNVPPTLTNSVTYATSTSTAVASLTNGENTYFCIYNGVNSTNITSSNLVGNTNYHYYVFGRNGGASGGVCAGATTYSATAATSTRATTPATPTTLVPTVGLTTANLAWTNVLGGEFNTISNVVEVYTDAAHTAPINGSPFTTSTASLALSNLTASTTYYVKIKSVTTAGESSYLTSTFTTSTPGQIGSGSTVSSVLPVNGYYGYSYSQQIYLADEVESVLTNGQHLITKIKYKNFVAMTPIANYNNWEVYVGNTNVNSFSADYSWIPSSTFTKVFDGIVNVVANSWVEVTFTQPYLWDGVSNLAIAVLEKAPGYTTSSGTNWNTYATTTNRSMVIYRDENVYSHNAPPLVTGNGTLSRTLVNNQIVIEGIVPADCMPPLNLVTSNVAATSFDVSWDTANNADGYTVYLFTENADPSTATPISTHEVSTNSFTASVQPETTYDVYVKSNCGGDDSTFSAKATVTTLELCPRPTNLAIDGFTGNSATVSWTSSATSFEIEYGIQGFELGTGTTVTSTTNTITLNNLTTEQTYDIYVKAICSDVEAESNWSTSISVKPSNVIVYTGGNLSTMFSSAPSISTNSTCPGIMTIVVPEGKQIASLTVEYSMTSLNLTYMNELRSYVKSPTLASGESVLVPGVGASTGTYAFPSRSLDFAVGATGTVVFELHTFRTYGGTGCSTNNGYVNNGTWKLIPVYEDVPNCVKPSELTATTTLNTATIGWSSEGTEFEVVYGPTGFEIGSGTLISNITSNSITLENLTTEQTYDFYVRNVCNEDEISTWSNVKSFKPGYCTPSVLDCSDGDNITKVTFQEINNITTCSPDGYGNYSSLVANVEAGGSYPINVTVGSGWSTESVAVWIDYNNNGNFEQNEYTFIGTGSGSVVTNTIQIPIDAATGQYRMRVKVIANAQSGILWDTACDNLDTFGETEDYTVSITNNVITWTGTEWINGTPNPVEPALIAGNLVVGTDYPNFEVGNLFVSSQGNLNIVNNQKVTVNGSVNNLGNATNFTVGNGGNLIQTAEAINVGAITVNKSSQPMLRLDYTMWSSPVANQGVQAFSPETLPNRIYTYEESGYVSVFADEEAPDVYFSNNRGYLFRSPNTWSSTTASPYPGVFTGVANNGTMTSTGVTQNGFFSIGNPYPSNIDAEMLMSANPSIGSLFFWTNATAAQDGTYQGNNYAYYNASGGTSADNSSIEPNGYISVGQGFIVRNDNTSSSIVFNNSMRTDANATSFRVPSTEKNRFWLNLINQENLTLNQILVGYIQGASNELDHQFDAELFAYEGNALYSNLDDKQLIIQGKALPFESSDIVPLGLNIVEAGTFKISLNNFDGLFSEGEATILLKDKTLNVVHNLMESDYGFEAAIGQINDRFEIIYQSEGEMGVTDLTNSSIMIYQNNKHIVVDAKSEKLTSVELFDLQGRQIHQNSKVNASIYQINVASFGPQVFVVKAKTAEGKTITKKVINK